MATTELTKADFQSDQETRWCPGCGDYAVLAAVQAFFPELNSGQLAQVLRAKFLVDVESFCKIQGQPLFAAEVAEAIEERA